MMPRIVARLDVRGERLIKGVRMEGRRVIGDPHEHAVRYYQQGADELLYVDAMASLCGFNTLHELIERCADDVFVPLTVSGGIRDIGTVRAVLRSGADRVCVNTGAVDNPDLIAEIASAFGSSTVAVSIDCAKREQGWEVMTDYGREATGLDAHEWAHRAQGLGAGEVIVTSIDRDGTRQGFDLDLVREMELLIPTTVCGGAATPEDCRLALEAGADAVAVASILHYEDWSIESIKAHLEQGGIRCRR